MSKLDRERKKVETIWPMRAGKEPGEMASQEERREDRRGLTLTLRASVIITWRAGSSPATHRAGESSACPVHSLISQGKHPRPRDASQLVWGTMAHSWEFHHWQPKFIEVAMKWLDFSTSLPLKMYVCVCVRVCVCVYFSQRISSSIFLMSTYRRKTPFYSKPAKSEPAWLAQFHFSVSFWMNNHKHTWTLHLPFSPQAVDLKHHFWTCHKRPKFGSDRFLRWLWQKLYFAPALTFPFSFPKYMPLAISPRVWRHSQTYGISYKLG